MIRNKINFYVLILIFLLLSSSYSYYFFKYNDNEVISVLDSLYRQNNVKNLYRDKLIFKIILLSLNTQSGVLINENLSMNIIDSSSFVINDFRKLLYLFYFSRSSRIFVRYKNLFELYKINRYFLSKDETFFILDYAIQHKRYEDLEFLIKKGVFRERRKEYKAVYIKKLAYNIDLIANINITYKQKKRIIIELFNYGYFKSGRALIKKYKIKGYDRFYLQLVDYLYNNKKEYIKLINKLINLYPKKRAYLYYKLARFYRKKDYQKAHKYYNLLVNKYLKTIYGQKSAWYLGWEYEKKLSLDSALYYYRKLSKLKLNSYYKNEATFRIAIINLRLRSYEKAKNCLMRLKDNNRKFFFLAKTYELEKKDSLANYYYDKIKKNGILDFYYIRTLMKNKIKLKIDDLPNMDFSNLYVDSIRFIRDIKLILNLKIYPFLLYLKPYYKKDMRFFIAYNFIYKNNREYSYKFVKDYYYHLNINRLSMEELKLNFPTFDVKFIDNKEFLYLIYSIAKQESQFSEKIVSPVGAVGFMQIMPYVARDLCKAKGYKFSLDSLYNREFNIKLGFILIKDLARYFSGNLIYSVASYNAGRIRVNRWRTTYLKGLKDIDIIIESLEFRETREYVKKVLFNFFMYNWIYEKKTIKEFTL